MEKIKKVWSPDGLISGPVNSLVGKNESIIDYDRGKASLVTKGVVGKDTQPSLAAEGDNIVIAGNDKDYIGALTGVYTGNKLLTFALQAIPYTKQMEAFNKIENKFTNKNYGKNSSLAKITAEVQLRELNKAKLPVLLALKTITDRQELQHDIENNYNNMGMYDKGKTTSTRTSSTYITNGVTRIPWWQRAVPGIAGLANSIALGLWWRKLDLHRPDIYAKNPYEARALNELASLQYNELPSLKAASDAERRAAFNNEQAGGLSGSQKYLGRIALGLGAMLNASNVYAAKQEADNKYRAASAEAALNAGNADAQRRMAANQYNDTAFAQAHGRKVKGIETSMLNAQTQLADWYKNEFKYRTWRDAMRLYIQDQLIQREALDAQRDGLRNANSKTPTTNVNVAVNDSTTVPPYLSGNPQNLPKPASAWDGYGWKTIPWNPATGFGSMLPQYGNTPVSPQVPVGASSPSNKPEQAYTSWSNMPAPYSGYNYNTVVSDNTPVVPTGNTSAAWKTEDPIYGPRYRAYYSNPGCRIDIWNLNDKDRYNYYRNNWPVMIGPDGRDMSSYMPFDNSMVREYGGKKYPYISPTAQPWNGWDDGYDGTTATWHKLLFDVDPFKSEPTNNSAWKHIGGRPYYRSAVPTLADYYTNYTNRLFNRR